MTISIPMRLVRYSVDLEQFGDVDVLADLVPFVVAVLNERYDPQGRALTFTVRRYDREHVEKLLERSPAVRSYRAQEVQW